MAGSNNNRDAIYVREAAFFDQGGESRKNLGFLYGGYGITLAFDQLYRFAGEVAGKRILDYGCGNGRDLVHLVKQGASVIGIELSKQSVFRSNQRLMAQQIPPTQAIALPVNAEHLGFEDNTFDIVLGTAISIFDWLSRKFIGF